MVDTDYMLISLIFGIAFTIVAVFGLILATNMIPLDDYGKNVLCDHFIEHKDVWTTKNFIKNMTRFGCLS